MIRAGAMRHRVDVKLPPTAIDSRGQITGDDRVVARDVPCAVDGLNGQELERARQVMATATHRVTMRRDSRFDLTTKHKLVLDGRTLNIGYINNVNEVGYELRLVCAEEV